MKYINSKYITNEQVLDESYTENISAPTNKAYKFIQACNFYKLFWIFIVGCIFGCYMEQIQYYLIKGIWESRAGVVWGPFSEIYGLGAILMFLISQIAKNSSPLTIFCTASICGSAFEYFARLFQEEFFGSITWDYSNQALNIGGRTSLKYGIYWGLLGLLFINWIFPLLNQKLENITGKLSFAFTWFLIIFMSLNLLNSALAVNRWNERVQGVAPNNVVDEFLDINYGNDKMIDIFPHLKFINTENVDS